MKFDDRELRELSASLAAQGKESFPMNITRRIFLFATAAATLLPVFAQQPTSLINVLHVRVKPDRTGDFRAAVQDYNAVLRKGNWSVASTLFVSTTGPSEYLLVRRYSNYAEMDVSPNSKMKDLAADLTRIMSRIQNCTEGFDTVIEQVESDLSQPRSNSPSKYLKTIRMRIRPEKVPDFLALMKSDLVPAVQKAGVKNHVMARVRYGAPRNEFVSATGFDSYAELDGLSPVAKAMGEEGYRKFNEKLRTVTLSNVQNIYRYLPDFSYVPASQVSASGN